MTEPEDPDDLDALVTELNAGARPADASDDGQTTRLRSWLEQAVARSASDLLLVAGAPPSVRVDGAVLPLAEAPLRGEEIADAVVPAPPPHARRGYRDGGSADCAFSTQGLCRLRPQPH